MKLQNIITQRNYNIAAPFKIVYEWEDIIAQNGKISLRYEKASHFHKVYGWIKRFHLVNLYKSLKSSENLSLFFVMKADVVKEPWLNKSTIPVIIDFWLKEADLPSFYQAYKDCPLVLVTSAEIVEFLKSHNCPLNIEHWPLSIPDYMKPKCKENYENIYDLCFLGRPSPYFVEMLKKYELSHPEFRYIVGSRSSKNREYIDNKGNFIAKDTGRESYINMIRSSKITCYTTPGLDSNKSETSMFNQVTPRLFEMLAGGCYVLAHYPDNADTRFYELDKYVGNIPNYDSFEKKLDMLRLAPPMDFSIANEFLDKHYTSTRIKMLFSILDNYKIKH